MTKYSKSWLLYEKIDLYKDYDIDWLINVGLPAETYPDPKAKKKYVAIIQTAWFMSFEESINLDTAIKTLTNFISDSYLTIDKERYLSVEKIGLFPEFIAQITGYVRSPSRRKYAHLLVDIGAGTLDAALFVVKEIDGDLKYPVYGKTVKQLGTEFLAKHRFITTKTNSFTTLDVMPSNKEFSKKLNVSLEQLSNIDSTFLDKVYKAIISPMQQVIQRDPAASNWTQDINVFLCGGGSNVDVYKDAIDKLDKNRYFPTKILPIPIPERLDKKGLKPKYYHRLSVAYGLSYDAFDLGETYDGIIEKTIRVNNSGRWVSEYASTNEK